MFKHALNEYHLLEIDIPNLRQIVEPFSDNIQK